MKRALTWTLLPIGLELLLIGGGHALLLAWFADGEVASVLFTGGRAVTPGVALGAVGFFVTRLLLCLVLPGLVLYHLGALAVAARERRTSSGGGMDPRGPPARPTSERP